MTIAARLPLAEVLEALRAVGAPAGSLAVGIPQ